MISTHFLILGICLIFQKNVLGQTDPCQAKVNQLQIEISLSARVLRLQVIDLRKSIQNNILTAQASINLQKSALLSEISLAVGPNAALCKNRAQQEISQLNSSALQSCSPSVPLVQLDSSVGRLNAIKNSASNICSVCAGVPVCSEGAIEGLKLQVTQIQNQVSLEAANISSGASSCVQQTSKKQAAVLEDVQQNFQACISS